MISYHSTHRGIDLRTGPPRSTGIHLSSVIRAAAIAMGTKEAARFHSQSLDALIRSTPPCEVGSVPILARVMLGYAWEDYAKKQLTAQDTTFNGNPGELALDGIIMTPDGISADIDDGYILHEIKSTSKSSRNPVTEDLLWMWQIAGYLCGMTAKFKEPCLTAEIHPLYLRGDYQGLSMHYLPQTVKFELEELQTIWNMLCRYKSMATPEIYGIGD